MTIANRTIPYIRPDEGMIALAVLEREYLKAPPPAQFKLIVSPLVLWIWIGGVIVLRWRPDRAMAGAQRSPPTGQRASTQPRRAGSCARLKGG